ncbi:MAG: hypothetical protein WCX27_01800 [Candidatus Paceibacterota bacterium]|jgi:hypothetical protein
MLKRISKVGLRKALEEKRKKDDLKRLLASYAKFLHQSPRTALVEDIKKILQELVDKGIKGENRFIVALAGARAEIKIMNDESSDIKDLVFKNASGWIIPFPFMNFSEKVKEERKERIKKVQNTLSVMYDEHFGPQKKEAQKPAAQ